MRAPITILVSVALGVVGCGDSDPEQTSDPGSERMSAIDCDLPRDPGARDLPRGPLQSKAEELYPGTFAGLWIDGDRTVIAFTERAAERAAELAGGFDRRPICTATATEPLVSLRARLREMIKDRERAGSGRLQGLPDAYDMGLDVEANRIEVTVDPAEHSEQVVDEFHRLYGDGVAVVAGPLARPE